MFSTLIELFSPTKNPNVTQSLILVMFTIALGIFLGNFKLKRISFGISAVMFTGLLMGHLGYNLEKSTLHFLRDFGLILFVYGIGIQVGLHFFSSLRQYGLQYNILAVSTAVLGGVVAFVIFKTTGHSIENVVGMMSGSVTNTPGLGAAKSILGEYREQFPDRSFVDPAIAYAITYPVGVLGVIGAIIFAKYIFKVDIDKESKEFELENKTQESFPRIRKVRVTKKEAIGLSIKEIRNKLGNDRVIFSRIKNSGSQLVLSPSEDMILKENDVLMMVGMKEDLEVAIELLGRESSDKVIERESEIIAKTLIVTQVQAVHKTLESLQLFNRYDLKVTRVFRGGKSLLAHPKLALFFGDKLAVVGNKWAIEQVEKVLGNKKAKLLEPDFVSLFGGLILGIILGSIPILIPSFPVPIKFGFAAGPLVVALLLSRFGGVGMINTYINNGAIYFMKDLGIALFFATVGIYAGQDFYDNFIKFNGWEWIGYGILITLIPLFIMMFVGRKIMKINFLKLVGLMSATYTDPAALSFSTQYFKSEIPTQSYVTVYPMVTIARILVAQLLILLFVQ